MQMYGGHLFKKKRVTRATNQLGKRRRILRKRDEENDEIQKKRRIDLEENVGNSGTSGVRKWGSGYKVAVGKSSESSKES